MTSRLRTLGRNSESTHRHTEEHTPTTNRVVDETVVRTDGETVTEKRVEETTVSPAVSPVVVTRVMNPGQPRNWASVESIIYIIATAIALVVIWVVGWVGDSQAYWNSLTRPSWGSNAGWQGFFLTLAVIVLWLATFLTTSAIHPSNGGLILKVWLYVLYGLQLVLLVVAVAVLFRQKSPNATFCILIVLIVLAVLQGGTMIFAGMRVVGLGFWPLVFLALYLIWLVYETVFIYRLWQDN